MKKTEIYVATIIDSYNYGTVLQAVATRGVLDKFGDTKFVDYRRAYWTNAELVKRCIRRTSNPIKGMLSAVSQMSNRIISHKIFRPFVEHHLRYALQATSRTEGISRRTRFTVSAATRRGTTNATRASTLCSSSRTCPTSASR